MKVQLRYFGRGANVGDLKLSELGQKVELSQEDTKVAVIGGASLIPANVYDAIGFTAEEVKSRRARNTDDFALKLNKAIEELALFRAALQDGKIYNDAVNSEVKG